MKKSLLIFGVILITSLTTVATSPAEAASPIQLGRIQYDSPGKDTTANASVNGEYVSVTNLGSRPVVLTRWTVRDLKNHVYTFGTYTLPAQRTVVIRTGRGTNGPLVRHWNRGWHVWNNTGDRASLRSAKGALMDTCSWDKHSGGAVRC